MARVGYVRKQLFRVRSVARAAVGLRFWFGRDTGTGFLSDAVDRWRKYSRAEASGASPVKNGDL